MIDWLYNIIGELTIIKTIMLVICLGVGILTIISLMVNLLDWLVNMYISFKDGWFQFSYIDLKDKIYRIKYDIYVVGYPSGEIFYVDKKRLSKLRRKGLVSWSNEIGGYVFGDKDVNKVKEVVSPLVIYETIRGKGNEYYHST
jgi:hypothetical protein